MSIQSQSTFRFRKCVRATRAMRRLLLLGLPLVLMTRCFGIGDGSVSAANAVVRKHGTEDRGGLALGIAIGPRGVELAAEFLRHSHHRFPRSVAWPARLDLDLIDRPVHRGFDTRSGPTFRTFPHQHALQPRDYRVDGVVGIHSRPFVRFDRTIDVDHFLAVRAPPEHLIKERAVSLTLEDEINQRREQRDRHKGKIAYVIEKHLELENNDVAQKLPALVAAGFDDKPIGRAHGAILNGVREGEKFRLAKWGALTHSLPLKGLLSQAG